MAGYKNQQGARTKLEAGQSSEATSSGVRNSVSQISGEDSRAVFLTPASAKDLRNMFLCGVTNNLSQAANIY